MRTSRWAIAALLVLGLAACGGDDDAAEPTTTTAAAATSDGGEATTSTDGATTTASQRTTAAPATTGGTGGAATTTDGGISGGTATTSGGTSGGGTTGGITDDELDVCALLTPADIEAVLGENPGTGIDTSYTPYQGCDYEAPSAYVQVIVLPWTSPEEAADSLATAVEINGFPPVDGVGDEAFDGAPDFGLTARSGRFEIEVNVAGATDPATQLDQERQLVAILIDRLP